jgi:uncharacterized protein
VAAGVPVASVLLLGSVASTCMVIIWALTSRRFVQPAVSCTGPLSNYALAFGLSFVSFGLASAAVALLHSVFSVPIITLSADILRGGYGWRTVVLVACVQPAIIEEIAFRGIILGSLADPLGPRQAVLVSAALFSIIHLSVPGIPHLLVLGIGLGALRVRSGSLYPGVLMHFCHNLLVVIQEWHGGTL